MHPGYGCLYSSHVAEVSIISSNSHQSTFCKKNNTVTKKIADKDEVFQLVQKIKKMGYRRIIFSGSDPAYHPNLLEFCKNAWMNNLTVAIATNGSILNPDMLEPFEQYISWLILPLYMHSYININANILDERSHTNHLMALQEKMTETEIGFHLYSQINNFNVNMSINPILQTLNPDLFTYILHYHGENSETTNDEFLLSQKDIKDFSYRNQEIRLGNGLRPSVFFSDEVNQLYQSFCPFT